MVSSSLGILTSISGYDLVLLLFRSSFQHEGYDEAMVPIDYKTEGMIRDGELFKVLICPMPKGGTCLNNA